MWIFKKNESISVLQQFNGGLYSYCTWDHLTRHHSTGNFTRLSSAADSPLVLFHLFTFSSLLISPAKHTHLFTMTVIGSSLPSKGFYSDCFNWRWWDVCPSVLHLCSTSFGHQIHSCYTSSQFIFSSSLTTKSRNSTNRLNLTEPGLKTHVQQHLSGSCLNLGGTIKCWSSVLFSLNFSLQTKIQLSGKTKAFKL